jgi:hypothetical protein
MLACDGIMVARGDLAVEVGDATVPALQKRMIRQARELNKLTITATQMMESMIASPVPTRAEVSDVANAVLDGTDAVMLSAESASGQYPVETVAAMNRICVEAEKSQTVTLDREFLDRVFTRVDQSIAMAALFTAYHLGVKAIASLTESGSTALWMSRLNCGVPIYALTAQTFTRYRCTLFRDTYPLMVKYVGNDREELLAEAEGVLVRNGVVKEGDLIVLTIGEPIGKSGGTNTMKIVKVGEGAVSETALLERVRARQWFYEFELPDGTRTRSTLPPGVELIHTTRLALMEKRLDRAVGRECAGLTAVDLACHQGWFALKLARRGFDSILAVDARAEHLADAQLMADVLGVKDAACRCGSISRKRARPKSGRTT